MSKHLLERTKLQFVVWLNVQDNTLKYEAMTTAFNANTELAHFRRSFVRTLNNHNLRELKK